MNSSARSQPCGLASEARAVVPEAEPSATFGLRDLLDQNPVVGGMRAGPKRFWTGREEKILRASYPRDGLAGCVPQLPGRSASSIYQRARILGLVSPRTNEAVPRQRYTSSDAIDAVIRRVYQATPSKGDIGRLARTVNRPRWWVSKRGAALGLAAPRFKSPRWSEAENEIVEAMAHRHPRTIRLALKRAGFERTETAITVQRKRLGASTEDPDHFTARGLAAVMGVDSKGVTAWIVKGWLRAKRRGTARVGVQGGDEWWIHRRDVRQFIVENVAAVDIRKVDKFWFVDLLSDVTLRQPNTFREAV